MLPSSEHPSSEIQDADEAEFDRIEREADEDVQAAVDAYRARGLEPAPTDAQWGGGTPAMSFSARWPDPAGDAFELRLGNWQENGWSPIWGESWPGPGAEVSQTAVLRFLTARWREIACDFLPVPLPVPFPGGPVLISMAAGIGRPDLPRYDLLVSGPGITVVTDAGRTAMESESVLVVQCLMALGDLICRHVRGSGADEDLAQEWEKVAAATDLPPSTFEFEPEGQEVHRRGDLESSAAFYARRLGCTYGDYRNSALWLHGRQGLIGAGLLTGDHVSVGDFIPLIATGRSPTNEQAMSLVTRAADAYGEPVGDYIDAALETQNAEAWQIVMYRNWPHRYGGTAAA